MNGESLKRKQAKSRLRICKMKVKKTAATTKTTLLTWEERMQSLNNCSENTMTSIKSMEKLHKRCLKNLLTCHSTKVFNYH